MIDRSIVEPITTGDTIVQGTETHAHPIRLPPLSEATKRGLARHVGRAFDARSGSASPLREAVQRAVAELLAAGATQEMIDAVLTHAVREHPDRYRSDRLSIITRVSAADALMGRVLAWARTPVRPKDVRGAVPSWPR